ncbi:MAG: CDP-alcohol phosphatidyltransferase family protein [Terriglobia bacterium]
MRRPLFTLANQLTLLRLALIPFFVLAVVEQRHALALGLFVAAAVSDTLDGLLARVLNQRTALGAYLDPITDKLLLSAAFVALAFQGIVPWPLSILVLSRDILILTTAVAILLATGFRPFRPSIYGKACTVAETVTVLVVLVDSEFSWAWLASNKNLFFWLTATLVVVSGLNYGYRVGKLLPDLPSKS